jgi:ribA/ribD-fused uncharacterized protein
VSEPLLIERGILLNFSRHGFWAPHPFRLELVFYKTVEHHFQAGKSLCYRGEGRADLLHDLIVELEFPWEAKRAGRNMTIDIKRWSDVVAPRRMLEGLLYKFSQNEDALSALSGTKDSPLVEHRPDPIWGDNMDGTGSNLMGLALEHVRSRLCP